MSVKLTWVGYVPFDYDPEDEHKIMGMIERGDVGADLMSLVVSIMGEGFKVTFHEDEDYYNVGIMNVEDIFGDATQGTLQGYGTTLQAAVAVASVKFAAWKAASYLPRPRAYQKKKKNFG